MSVGNANTSSRKVSPTSRHDGLQLIELFHRHFWNWSRRALQLQRLVGATHRALRGFCGNPIIASFTSVGSQALLCLDKVALAVVMVFEEPKLPSLPT